jgi:hypothetical protein
VKYSIAAAVVGLAVFLIFLFAVWLPAADKIQSPGFPTPGFP